MSEPTDRNLLLGIMALQMGFIDRDGLFSAMNAWGAIRRSRWGPCWSGKASWARENRSNRLVLMRLLVDGLNTLPERVQTRF